MRNSQFVCPKCKQKTGVNIEYGMPGIEQAEQAERQEIVLGGASSARTSQIDTA